MTALPFRRARGRSPVELSPAWSDRVPVLAAAAVAVVGVVNVASALTAPAPGRVHALLSLAPVGDVTLAHAFALPAGLALMVVAWQLARRRRRGLTSALGLLGLLGVLNLLKGLDVEEAAVSWALAGGLWRARGAFTVRHERPRWRGAAGRAVVLLAGAWAAGTASVVIAGDALQPAAGLMAAPGRALALLTVSATGLHAGGDFAWLGVGLGALGLGTAVLAIAPLFAPARLLLLGGAADRVRAAAVVRRHGSDTLSAFKLRADLPRRWSADGRALVSVRQEAGTLLLAGDPVGPPDAAHRLLAESVAQAHAHGLRLGVVGASDAMVEAAREIGLRSMYLGDEAILQTGDMDVSGGAMKSLRKAVNRVAREGFTAELQRVGDLSPDVRDALHAISESWRDGVPERGFSMGHDRLVDDLLPDALIVLARDDGGAPRGFLHFMPVYGRQAVSLAFMRRERDTPNGLMDFLVVKAAHLLAAEGIEEFSLNFAAFGRWLRAPANRTERVLARVLRVGDRWFQVERLYRYNAKFRPRWQARHLLYDHPAALPRIALAAMWAEGQLPRPPLGRAPWRPPAAAPAPALHWS